MSWYRLRIAKLPTAAMEEMYPIASQRPCIVALESSLEEDSEANGVNAVLYIDLDFTVEKNDLFLKILMTQFYFLKKNTVLNGVHGKFYNPC